jgi:hyperosmotically inducible protein
MLRPKQFLLDWIVSLCVLALCALLLAPALPARAKTKPDRSVEIQARLDKELHNKKFQGIHASVDDDVVTLTGTVRLFADEAQAIKIAQHVDGVRAVRNDIAVSGPEVSDAQLQQQILQKIQIDRAGFGEVFDAVGVEVRNGVVLLGGHAVDPTTEEDAVAIAEYMPGVKAVLNKIQVDPLSPMDDQTRMAVFQAIYNYGPLQQYATMPIRPIRISVQDGHVTLYGVVFTAMDKEIAGMRANQVPGVFRVTNDLHIAGQGRE